MSLLRCKNCDCMWSDNWHRRSCWYCGSDDWGPYWKMTDRPELTQVGADTTVWEDKPDDWQGDLDAVLVRRPIHGSVRDGAGQEGEA